MDTNMINYARLKDKKGPCPACGLHINVGEQSCIHCNHLLTTHELASIEQYAVAQKLRGTKKALVFIPVVFMLIYLLFVFIQ